MGKIKAKLESPGKSCKFGDLISGIYKMRLRHENYIILKFLRSKFTQTSA